jgi:hypothetical protein
MLNGSRRRRTTVNGMQAPALYGTCMSVILNEVSSVLPLMLQLHLYMRKCTMYLLSKELSYVGTIFYITVHIAITARST